MELLSGSFTSVSKVRSSHLIDTRSFALRELVLEIEDSLSAAELIFGI
jgi:hypothetical protein